MKTLGLIGGMSAESTVVYYQLLNQLVRELEKVRDPKRPVRMIIIGIGLEVDRNELETIAKASGSGAVFVAEDPADMGDIILQAIASRKGA